MSAIEDAPDKPRAPAHQVIAAWWRREMGDRKRPAARALSARLRRASLLEALAESAVHELGRKLGLKPSERGATALQRLALVLAWVREDDGATLAQRLGRGESPPMSPLRFQRLMRAEGDELIVALRRALALADHRCNVGSLGSDLLYWNDRTRTTWSFHYFGAQAPQPEADSSLVEEPTP